MYRRIGEAVLALLKSDKPVSSNALINQLELMAANADDEAKVVTIRKAIVEVRNGMVAARKRTSSGHAEHDNVSHRLNSDGPPEGSKNTDHAAILRCPRSCSIHKQSNNGKQKMFGGGAGQKADSDYTGFWLHQMRCV